MSDSVYYVIYHSGTMLFLKNLFGGSPTWTDNQQKAYRFSDCNSAKRYAEMVNSEVLAIT